MVFDPQFRDQNVTVDLRKTSLEDALQAVTTSTRNFYKISAAKTITVIPDTPAKRREYEDEIIRTFFLSNADVKETLDLLRLVVDNRRLSPVAGVNAIAIKDTPDKIAAAGRVIRAIDKARAEVVIDVELLEVDRAKLHEYGLQLASPGSPGISGSVDANRPNMTLSDLGALTTADVFVTGLPGLYYRLIKTDGTSRTLANPQLRTADGLPSSARFGEDVPVPTVTFAPIASGGVNQQPITSFTYRTIGVNIEITPRLHHDDDISLRLKLEVSNLSGVGYQNLPTFGTRYIETTIRLRDGETNMLAGLIRDDERTTLEGIAGLSDLPIIGQLFGHTKHETQADRHRADADAADRPRARPRRRATCARSGSAATRAAASTSCRCPRSSRSRRPRRRRTTTPRRRHLPAGVDADRASAARSSRRPTSRPRVRRRCRPRRRRRHVRRSDVSRGAPAWPSSAPLRRPRPATSDAPPRPCSRARRSRAARACFGPPPPARRR